MKKREKRGFWGLENWGFGGANVLLWRGGFEGREEGLEGRGLGRVGRVGPEGVPTCHFCTKKNHLR